MAFVERGTKKVGCLYELFIIYNKHAPDETSWPTHDLNDCHNGQSQCIDKIVLSALPAARLATREEVGIDAKVLPDA